MEVPFPLNSIRHSHLETSPTSTTIPLARVESTKLKKNKSIKKKPPSTPSPPNLLELDSSSEPTLPQVGMDSSYESDRNDLNNRREDFETNQPSRYNQTREEVGYGSSRRSNTGHNQSQSMSNPRNNEFQDGGKAIPSRGLHNNNGNAHNRTQSEFRNNSSQIDRNFNSSPGNRPSTTSTLMNRPDSSNTMRNNPSPLPGGEPLHDMDRAVSLLKSSKFYAEGFLMKKVEVGADGKAHPNSSESQWAKWFVQLSGTIMSTWNAQEMEEAAREGRTVPPQYLNLSDSFLHPFPPSAKASAPPTSHQFALNSAGLNRLLFCAPNATSFIMWINAIRLAGWEKSRCNEIYTGSLLGLKEPKLGWLGFEGGLGLPGSKGKFEGWLKARLPGDTEWRRVWTVVIKANVADSSAASTASIKKSRRSSILGFGKKKEVENVIEDLPGDGAIATIAFYTTNKLTKKERPICIVQHLFYAAAIFPETEKLIEISSLFKIEGTFLNPVDGYRMGWGVGGRAEKQGYALLMLDEGDATMMLQWIVGLSDVFKLYGRPRGFSYDPRDPSSMYFALPVGAQRDRQFLDRELVDHLDVNESRPRAIRAVLHNILFDRMRGAAQQPRPLLASANSNDASIHRSESPMDRTRESNSNSNSNSNSIGRNSLDARRLVEEEGQDSGPPTRRFVPSTAGLSRIGETENTQDLKGVDRIPENRIPEKKTFDYLGAPTSRAAASPISPIEYNGDYENARGRPAIPPFRNSTSPPLSPVQGNGQNYSRPIGNPSDDSEYSSEANHAENEAVSATELSTPISAERQIDLRDRPHPTVPQLSSPGAPYTDNIEQNVFQNDHERSLIRPALHLDVGSRQAATRHDIIAPPMPTNSRDGPTPVAKPLPLPSPTEPVLEDPVFVEHTTPRPLPARSIYDTMTVVSPTIDQEFDQSRNIPHMRGISETSLPRTIPSPKSLPSPKPLPSPNPTARTTESIPLPPTPFKARNSFGYDMSDDQGIKADLLAAMNFMENSDDTAGSPQTIAQSPSVYSSTSAPPSRTPSTGVEVFNKNHPEDAQYAERPSPAIPTVHESPNEYSPTGPAPTSFPSTFAKNKRTEERVAAAQLAQQAQQIQATRPGRAVGSNAKGKQRAWQDSDDEEEPEEESEEEEEDNLPPLAQPSPAFAQSPYGNAPSLGGARDSYYSTTNEPAYDNGRNYYENNRPESTYSLPPQASPSINGMVPAMSPHGLLHAGLLDKADRSARNLEVLARDTGGPLVSIPSKPPPPQTGLVGAITSHQREKERTGGVGRAITEQQRDRKLAESRQKQLDEGQRMQLLQQQQMQMQMQQQQMQFGGGFGGYGNNGMGMMNPWMMAGGMGGGYGSMNSMGSMNGGMNGMGMGNQGVDPMMQQQAMMMANQMYMQAMAQFQAQQQQAQQQSPNPTSPSFNANNNNPLPSSPSLYGMPSSFGQFQSPTPSMSSPQMGMYNQQMPLNYPNSPPAPLPAQQQRQTTWNERGNENGSIRNGNSNIPEEEGETFPSEIPTRRNFSPVVRHGSPLARGGDQ